jgi:hypothetical protein
MITAALAVLIVAARADPPPLDPVETATVATSTAAQEPADQLATSGDDFSLRFTAGYRARSFLGILMNTGAFSVGIGWRHENLRIYGGPDFAYGKTEDGLTTYHVRAAGTVEYGIGRLWFGGTISAGDLAVQRVTGSDTLAALTLGIGGLFEVDVVQVDTKALFVGIAGAFELTVTNVTYEGTAMIGWRT